MSGQAQSSFETGRMAASSWVNAIAFESANFRCASAVSRRDLPEL
jgi:hypothetical protein